jgi:hypothetical protein
MAVLPDTKDGGRVDQRRRSRYSIEGWQKSRAGLFAREVGAATPV